MNKGFVLMLDAIISIIIILSIIPIIQPKTENPNFEEKTLFQKANDLLKKISALDLSEQEIIEETGKAFQNQTALLEINGKEYRIGKKIEGNKTQSISTKLLMSKGNLFEEKKIRLKVFFEN